MGTDEQIQQGLRQGIESGTFVSGDPAPWSAMGERFAIDALAHGFRAATRTGLLTHRHDRYFISPGLAFAAPTPERKLTEVQRRLYGDIYLEHHQMGRPIEIQELGRRMIVSASDLDRILVPLERRSLIERQAGSVVILPASSAERERLPHVQWSLACEIRAAESNFFAIGEYARTWSTRISLIQEAFDEFVRAGVLVPAPHRRYSTVANVRAAALAPFSEPTPTKSDYLVSMFEAKVGHLKPAVATRFPTRRLRTLLPGKDADRRHALDTLARKGLIELTHQDDAIVTETLALLAAEKRPEIAKPSSPTTSVRNTVDLV